MAFSMDRNSREPLFRQLARQMADLITSGQWPLHHILTPERKLAEELGISRNTITAAYQELVSQGLVRKTQGSGTQVCAIPDQNNFSVAVDWDEFWNKKTDNPLLMLKKKLHLTASVRDTINLALGELPSDSLTRLPLQNYRHSDSLGYIFPKFDRQYRSAIAQHLQQYHQIPAHEDNILLTSGVQQALFLIVNCLLKPGDAVAVESSSYAYSQNLFLSAGLRVLPLAMDTQGVLPDSVVQLYEQHKIRMIFINPTFQNPTGAVLGMQRRRELYARCAERKIPIVEDDPYSLLHLTEKKPPPAIKAMYPKSDLVLYLGTTSKVLTPALRSGWMVGPKTVIDRLSDARREIDNGSSAILQGMTRQLLADELFIPHLESIRQSLERRRKLALHYMNRYLSAYATWEAPEGGFYVWCELKSTYPIPNFLKYCAAEGVMVMPGQAFGIHRRHFRLTYSQVPEDRLEQGIVRLARACKLVSAEWA